MQPPVWLGHGWLPAKQLVVLFDGVVLTAMLSLAVCLIATVIGIVMALAVHYGARWLRWSVFSLIQLHRNTPLMVQLLIWYFAVPGLFGEEARIWLNTPHSLSLTGSLALSWPSYEVLAALLALSLYGSAFIAEEVRAGLSAIPRGQPEAARAMGLAPFQAFRFVILPQVLAMIRRPLVGQYTAVIKNTSLTMAIGVAELSYRSRQVESETLLTFQAFAVATLLYLVVILAGQWLGRQREPVWRGAR